MNLLFVLEQWYPYGGAELSLWKLCRYLTQKGHQISVITRRRSGEVKHEITEGIEVFRPFPSGNILSRMIFSMRLYPYLQRFLKKNKVDLVYNIGYVPTLPTTYVAAKNHIPVVTSIGCLSSEQWFSLTNWFLATFYYLMEKLVIRLGKHTILQFQCEATREKVKPLIKTPTAVICNTFLEPAEINQVRQETPVKALRETLKIKEDELFLLSVGALTRPKNIARLLETLAGLRVKFKFVSVGEGPERAKIENLRKRLNLGEKVILLGQKPHDETLAIIRACDVFILPSISEQVPNVVLEALALGKPVIATKVGGVPEIKSANLHLIHHLTEINQILTNGIKAREEAKIVEEYSLDNVAGQYERLFARLTSSGVEAKRV